MGPESRHAVPQYAQREAAIMGGLSHRVGGKSMLLFNRAFTSQLNLDRRSTSTGNGMGRTAPCDSFLFSVEGLQQHLQLLESQFEFLGHLRPRGFRDVGKVEPYRSRARSHPRLAARKAIYVACVFRAQVGIRRLRGLIRGPTALLRYALIMQSR
jgi:hypothetical protein